MKKILLFTFCFLINVSVFSQTTLTGTIINSGTRLPMQGISVQLQESGQRTLSGFDGSFHFEQVTPGAETLIISSPEIITSETTVNITENQTNDTGIIYTSEDVRRLFQENSQMLLDEETFGEDADQGDYNILSLMSASNDVYTASTAFNFSAVRFRTRGYDNRYADMFINGVNFNDPIRGGFSYGIIGGLNDATRNKDVVNGLNPSTFTFGQIGGAGNINTRAGSFSQGGRAAVAYTNRNYILRGSTTYATGLMQNGWAFTGSIAYRWAEEGFIEGTFYNSLGYMFAAEKEFNSRHSLSLTTLGAPTQRGQQSPILQEVADLTGNNYHNVFWGWDEGKKRNSRIVTSYEPTTVLSHTFNIDKNTRLTTGAGFKYTMYNSTRLDWFNSWNPTPDYQRNLPSFQSDVMPDTTQSMRDFYTELWQNLDPRIVQVDWERLRRVNEQETMFKDANDGSALYIVEKRHSNQMLFSLNSTLNTKLNEQVSFTGGVNASTTKGMYFKTMQDLLGAEYHLDVDQFTARENISIEEKEMKRQNDLNNPNRRIKEGDRYGYDYDIYVNSVDVWFQNNHQYKNWDIFYGAKTGYTSFWRDGNMRNGRAPENSYGKGETHSFFNTSSKLGLTYKLSGNHLFSGYASYSVLPPLAYNSYMSWRIKDDAIPNLTAEKIFSAVLGYNFSTPIFRGNVSVFHTNFYDRADIRSYYSDYDGSFVNYALTGINNMHRGVEFGVKANVNSYVSLSLAGTIAEYIYTNRPTGTVSFENGSQADRSETVFLKNFHVGGTPQTAGTFGIHVFYKFWFFDMNINGFDRAYIDMAPNKRTELAVASLELHIDDAQERYEAAQRITAQEKFKGGFTVDCSVGKSLRIAGQYTLNINLQFKNILDNTNLKTGGYEQMRFDYVTSNIGKFPNKYFYAQGFNCYLNAGIRF